VCSKEWQQSEGKGFFRPEGPTYLRIGQSPMLKNNPIIKALKARHLSFAVGYLLPLVLTNGKETPLLSTGLKVLS
jgi:hypothetical protein